MRVQLTSQWPKRHVLAAPWGTALATWLLTIYYEPAPFANMVSMGAMIYGMVMSILELGVPMAFYAYEKIKNDRANLRKQAREEGLAEGRAEGRAEGQAKGKAEGRAEGVAETINTVRAKFEEDPNLSPEDLLEALMASLNDTRNNRNGEN